MKRALALLSALAFGASSSAARGGDSPAASASARATVLPLIRGSDIPTEPSVSPQPAEWQTARAVGIDRGALGRCKLRLVREWLEIRCEGVFGGGLVAGDPAGVSVRVLGNPDDPKVGIWGVHTLVVLPIRRGESRIVSFLDIGFEYEGLSTTDGGMLSVAWRGGKADPVLTASGLPQPVPPAAQ